MFFKISFTLTQIKRTKVYAMRDTIMQTALIIFQPLLHPTGCTATGYKNNVIAILYPVGPEILKFGHKFAALRIHPWHLVEEDNLACIRAMFQILFKLQKSIMPTVQNRNIRIASESDKCITEVLQL